MEGRLYKIVSVHFFYTLIKSRNCRQSEEK